MGFSLDSATASLSKASDWSSWPARLSKAALRIRTTAKPGSFFSRASNTRRASVKSPDREDDKLSWLSSTALKCLLTFKNKEQRDGWVFNVLSYRASPQRSPSACGCWVCTPGGFHRLVYKPPGPRPRSAAPGTGCTEKHTQRFMQNNIWWWQVFTDWLFSRCKST